MEIEISEKEVILEIENIPVKCQKNDLIKNSDYFTAMFTGNFSERNKSIIKLEGIDLKSMNLILLSIWDPDYMFEDDDILLILQTACMLQFIQIRDKCISRLTEILNVTNCIKIWVFTELLDLKPLCGKAKNLSLIEFDTIKTHEYLMELSLSQLHKYLANIYLQCNERDVFMVCMNWYYENGGDIDTLLALFNCVDFNRMKDEDIKEVLLLDDISTNTFVVNLLESVMNLKNGYEIKDKTYVELASKYHGCNRRERVHMDPMFFATYSNGDDNTEVIQDIYKRRRKCLKLQNTHSTSGGMLLYDEDQDKFVKCVDISQEKHKFEGYHIVGYKEFIFLFGGEITMGSGNWNLNFYVYDTFRDRWERKTKMPQERRHFSSCVCGNYLFVVGGTGSFRIIQENMFWYNHKENIWSTQIVLPCSSHYLKICNYKDQLFLLNLNNLCGYLFSTVTATFTMLPIKDSENLVSQYPYMFSLFSYNDRIYVKDSSLIEFELTDNKLYVRSCRKLDRVNSDTLESAMCRDTLYTLYKNANKKTLTIEKFSMLTYTASHIVHDVPEHEIQIEDARYVFSNTTKVFMMQHHYKMSKPDVYINNFS